MTSTRRNLTQPGRLPWLVCLAALVMVPALGMAESDADAYEPLTEIFQAPECDVPDKLAGAWDQLADQVRAAETEGISAEEDRAGYARFQELLGVSDRMAKATQEAADARMKELGTDLLAALDGLGGLDKADAQATQIGKISKVYREMAEYCRSDG